MVWFKGIEEPSVKDPNDNFVDSKIVPVKNVEAVTHDSESESAAAIALVAQIVFIEIDLSKVKDRVISS